MADSLGALAAVAIVGMATTFIMMVGDLPGVQLGGRTGLFLAFALLLLGVMGYSAFSR